jgi:hypothetical protein
LILITHRLNSSVLEWIDDSSNKDINLSIEGTEYDEAAIIQALAEQYGVPASYIQLSVTDG